MNASDFGLRRLKPWTLSKLPTIPTSTLGSWIFPTISANSNSVDPAMNDFIQHLAAIKPATVIPALMGAALAVLLEFKRHTWATASLAILSGALVAYVATEPLMEWMALPKSASNALAGVLGISGRNLIIWLLAVSKDPIAAWKNMGKK